MFRCAFYFALAGVVAGDFNLLLLHTNDMHARFQQADKYCGLCESDSSTLCYGGFARLHTAVSSLKQTAASNGRPTIFLNAGDTYQGTPYYTFFKWRIVAEFINMLGLDVMSLGNHEFDDGVSGLAPYIANVSVPMVCANLNRSQEPSLIQPNLTPSVVLSVNNVKIGVIGYLTPDTKYLSNIGKLQILDEIPSIRAEAEKMRAAGVNILIALGHSGYVKDQQIAKEVEEIDLVVGGHSHTFLYSGTPPDIDIPQGPYPTVITQQSGKQVPVVQAFYATKYLGYLELNFDDSGNLKSFKGSPILLQGNMPQDPNILQHLEPYEANITAYVQRVIGYTEVVLDNNNFKCKLGECNIGNLITDGYVDYVARNYNNSQGWTLAAVAINQAGGIRGSIDTRHNENHNGSIVVGDVIVVLPWGGNVVILEVLGQVLWEALEFSVARYEETISGHVSEFLQVSGIHVVYNVNNTVGSRVVSVSVRCADCEVPEYRPINLSETYRVIMSSYIATGGDAFSMFPNCTTLTVLPDVDYVLISNYIEQLSIIYPTIEGRIIIQKEVPSAAPRATSSWVIMITIVLAYVTTFKSL